MSMGRTGTLAGQSRAGIKSDLAMISSGNVDWPQLVANGEKLGIGIEQEGEYFRDQYARRGVG